MATTSAKAKAGKVDDDAARLVELRSRQRPSVPGGGTLATQRPRPVPPKIQGTPAPVMPVRMASVTPPAAAVATAAPEKAAAAGKAKEPEHELKALILPAQGRRLKPADVQEGLTCYVVIVKDSPWFAQFPKATRVLVATERLKGAEVGSVIPVGHRARNRKWWGDWLVVGITSREGEQLKVEGELPDWAQASVGRWDVSAVPEAEQGQEPVAPTAAAAEATPGAGATAPEPAEQGEKAQQEAQPEAPVSQEPQPEAAAGAASEASPEHVSAEAQAS